MTIHDDYKALGVGKRLAAQLPELDPRSDFQAHPSNRAKITALIRTRYDTGNPAPALSESQKQEYLQQFQNFADMMRNTVAKPGGQIRTPQEIRANAAQASGYFVVEWRIKTVNKDPQENACGCGCGCGCGG